MGNADVLWPALAMWDILKLQLSSLVCDSQKEVVPLYDTLVITRHKQRHISGVGRLDAGGQIMYSKTDEGRMHHLSLFGPVCWTYI